MPHFINSKILILKEKFICDFWLVCCGVGFFWDGGMFFVVFLVVLVFSGGVLFLLLRMGVLGGSC
jgi:hypothetical protein